jgi:dihydroxyacetone kinase
MTDITIDAVERAIRATTATVLRNEEYFSNLDALAGDGDFGASLAAGFRVIEVELPNLDKSNIGAFLLKLSLIISKHVGGSSGPLWGTAFMRAGMICKDKTSMTLEDMEKIVTAAIEGIQARGGALPGDKTLIDVLIPIRDALNERAKLQAVQRAAARVFEVLDGLVKPAFYGEYMEAREQLREASNAVAKPEQPQ